MSNNPFVQFKDYFPNSKPLEFISADTYRKLPYDLLKYYEKLPRMVDPVISLDELDERGIKYSTSDTYTVKDMYKRLLNQAIQVLGFGRGYQPPEEVSRSIEMTSEVPLYELGDEQSREPPLIGGKRRSRKTKRKSRKPKRKPKRKSRKS